MPKKKPKKKSKTKTELERNPALYRVKLFCEISRKCLVGEKDPPCGLSRQDWVLYNMCHALEDIATALMN